MAKLNEKKLTQLSQSIYFDLSEANNELKLLELNDHLLKTINEGKSLQFKGKYNSSFFVDYIIFLDIYLHRWIK